MILSGEGCQHGRRSTAVEKIHISCRSSVFFGDIRVSTTGSIEETCAYIQRGTGWVRRCIWPSSSSKR